MGPDKAVFMFGVCAYYNNASGPGQSHVHVWCVSITGTPVGPDKAVFMFGVCAYYRNAVDRDKAVFMFDACVYYRNASGP